MGEAVGVAFGESGRAVVRIPEGFHGGDLVVLELQPGRTVIRWEVLEALVRAWHELDEGPREPETNEPMTDHVECACGWCGKAKDRGSRRGQHAAHVEHAVREALAGRAAL